MTEIAKDICIYIAQQRYIKRIIRDSSRIKKSSWKELQKGIRSFHSVARRGTLSFVNLHYDFVEPNSLRGRIVPFVLPQHHHSEKAVPLMICRASQTATLISSILPDSASR